MECSLAKNELKQPAHVLPLTPEDTGITTVALSAIEANWDRIMHKKLLSSPGHILNAVWIPNPFARLMSSQSPHFVTTDDKNLLILFTECLIQGSGSFLKLKVYFITGNQLPHLSLVFDFILI